MSALHTYVSANNEYVKLRGFICILSIFLQYVSYYVQIACEPTRGQWWYETQVIGPPMAAN